MGLLNCASRYSVWHGYDYYKNKRVESLIKYSDCDFSGVVKGTKKYEVKINAEHPRKSSCNCPRANGKRTICKHMIALYFAAFPEEAEKYYNTVKKKPKKPKNIVKI